MAAILSRPQCVTHCCQGKVASILQTTFWYHFFLICVTFAYVIFMKWIWRRRSAILSLTVGVNTLWQRQSDLCVEEDIFSFILNFTWDLTKNIVRWLWKCRIQMTTKLSRLRHFKIHFLIRNCFIILFFIQILLQCVSKFPNTSLLYYFIILH